MRDGTKAADKPILITSSCGWEMNIYVSQDYKREVKSKRFHGPGFELLSACLSDDKSYTRRGYAPNQIIQLQLDKHVDNNIEISSE